MASCQLIISDIEAFDVPDADKKGGSGTSDPYLRFTLVGHQRASGRTEAKRNTRKSTWCALNISPLLLVSVRPV
jgi:hypothetical protein